MGEAVLDVALGKQDERLKAVERDVGQIKASIGTIERSVTELRIELAKRPSWFTAGLFSVLCGVIASLATYIITRV